MTASSATQGHGPELAADENVRTWWQAESTDSSEWLCMDLGEISRIHAVQINFADDVIDMPAPGEYRDGDRYIDDAPMFTRWLLEGSEDGEHFHVLEDKREAETDLSHDLIVTEEGWHLGAAVLLVFLVSGMLHGDSTRAMPPGCLSQSRCLQGLPTQAACPLGRSLSGLEPQF